MVNVMYKLTLSAISGLLLVACAAPTGALRLAPSGKLVPLVNGPEPGTAVGKCIQMGKEGPTTHPCPMDLAPLIDRNLRRGEEGRGTYARGVYVDAEELERVGSLEAGINVPATAYELATYHSTHAVWKVKVDENTAANLERLCADPAAGETRVIVREFEGCGVTMTGDLGDAPNWSISTLATQGTVLGQPKTFWSQEPNQKLPPARAKCASSRVVRVEVLSVNSLCLTMLRPAREGVKRAVALD